MQNIRNQRGNRFRLGIIEIESLKPPGSQGGYVLLLTRRGKDAPAPAVQRRGAISADAGRTAGNENASLSVR
ncbi:hypothetical protein [Brucella abortus]|uniref:hypothetical protein n=1 Tax=Brucella abortus TaxID=235 RepID=UPI001FFC4866|nr:hypothetical protein [Brucella abortus]